MRSHFDHSSFIENACTIRSLFVRYPAQSPGNSFGIGRFCKRPMATFFAFGQIKLCSLNREETHRAGKHNVFIQTAVCLPNICKNIHFYISTSSLSIASMAPLNLVNTTPLEGTKTVGSNCATCAVICIWECFSIDMNRKPSISISFYSSEDCYCFTSYYYMMYRCCSLTASRLTSCSKTTSWDVCRLMWWRYELISAWRYNLFVSHGTKQQLCCTLCSLSEKHVAMLHHLSTVTELFPQRPKKTIKWNWRKRIQSKCLQL